MRKLTILVLLAVVAPAWAGLGDLGKLKKLVDKKDDKAKKEEKKECTSEESSECSTAEPADPAKPTNKPEDVDKGGDVKTLWHDAKVGQTVKSKMPNDIAMQMEVVEVKDRVILIKSTTFMKGKPVSKSLMYFPKFSKKTEAKEGEKKTDVKVTDLPDETLKIGDRKVKCKVRKTEMQQNGKTITSIVWTSEDILGQTAKCKSDAMGKMQVMSEVVEFKK